MTALDSLIDTASALAAELRSLVEAVATGRRSPKRLLEAASRLMDSCEGAASAADADNDLGELAHALVQHAGLVVRAHMLVSGIGEREDHLAAMRAMLDDLDETIAGAVPRVTAS